MAKVRIELDRPGVRLAALASRAVRAAVGDVAESMAAYARGRTENEIEVTHAGRSRARSYVRMLGADAAAEEAKERILGSAIDAGRI
jgi:hypothetical protein